MNTIDPLVGELIEKLSPDLRESFEERAGILEFDAGVRQCHAECLALLMILSRHPDALTGVTVLQVQQGGRPVWLLTTDWATACQLEVDHAVLKRGSAGLAEFIASQPGGVVRVVPAES